MNASFLSTWTSFKNLVWKEKRESFGPLVFGLAIFAIVPAGLELLDGCLNSFKDIYPLIFWALLFAGWLFALGVGALMVCRDLGKSEENFISAQPISSCYILTAKFFSGIMVLTKVVIASFLLECIFRSLNVDIRFIVHWLLVAGFMISCFSISFATSLLTRQILSGFMVAGLLILILAVAPLLSTNLNFLYPFKREIPFAMTLGVVNFISLIAIFFFSKFENPVLLGSRTLAWLIAGITLGLFLISLHEVGNAWVVRSRIRVPMPEGEWQQPLLFQKDGFAYYLWGTSHYERTDLDKMYKTALPPPSIMRFRVNSSGQVVDFSKEEIPLLISRNDHSNVINQIIVNYVSIREDGAIEICFSIARFYKSFEWRSKLEKLVFTWPSDGTFRVLSQELINPPISHPNQLLRIYPSEHFYFLTQDADKKQTIYVYDKSMNLKYSIALPVGVHLTPSDRLWILHPFLKADLELRLITGAHSRQIDNISDEVVSQSPEILLDQKKWHFHGINNWFDCAQEFTEFDRLHYENLFPVRKGNWAYLSDSMGLRVLHRGENKKWAVVNEWKSPPLLIPFRSGFYSELIGDFFLWENGGADSINVYDISNPPKLIRKGFVNHYPESKVLSFHGRYLVTIRDFGQTIEVLDYPK